ncbi:MAG: SAM-dependent methyltransferase, partial [Pedobacter sp.]
MDKQTHWETVYQTKQPDQVSWTQEVPKTSLDFISSFNVDKSAAIIDVGGGDSKLVDFL